MDANFAKDFDFEWIRFNQSGLITTDRTEMCDYFNTFSWAALPPKVVGADIGDC